MRIIHLFLIFFSVFVYDTYAQVIYVVPGGAGNKTGINPQNAKASIEDALKDIPKTGGGEIQLLSGEYTEYVSTSNKDGLIIKAAAGHTPVLNGTDILTDTWSVHQGHIYKTTISEDVWQLFVDNEMINAARWPNVSSYIETPQTNATSLGVNAAYAKIGGLWDQDGTWGHSSGQSTEGSMIEVKKDLDTLSFSLAKTYRIDYKDLSTDLDNDTLATVPPAIAILNTGAFRSTAADVTAHTPGELSFLYDWEQTVVTFEKPGHSHYYLEGKLELLDTAGEWFYQKFTDDLDPTNDNQPGGTLYVWTKDSTNPNNHVIRGKRRTYGLHFKNCKNSTLEGLTFFGTTMDLHNSVSNTIEGCTFSYPSYSKRMLRVMGTEVKKGVTITKHAETEVTRITGSNSYNTKFLNNIVQYAEGEGLVTSGNTHTFRNNLFRHIDFACVNLKGLAVGLNLSNKNNLFEHNTCYVFGSSVCVSPGGNNIIRANDLSKNGYLQIDGTLVQYTVAPTVYSNTSFNWFHDTVKTGMRYDGTLELGNVVLEKNTAYPGVWDPTKDHTRGLSYGNTSWNCLSGLFIKGDWHVVANNTIFQATNFKGEIDLIGSVDTSADADAERVGLIFMNPTKTTGNKPGTGANKYSICRNNLARKLSGFRGSLGPDKYPLPDYFDASGATRVSNNWNGFYDLVALNPGITDSRDYTFDIENMLQDTDNFDFRPLKDGAFHDQGSDALAMDYTPWETNSPLLANLASQAELNFDSAALNALIAIDPTNVSHINPDVDVVNLAYEGNSFDIGAYEFLENEFGSYNIPGRRETAPSFPIPANGSVSNADKLMLAWKHAYANTVAPIAYYDIYLCEGDDCTPVKVKTTQNKYHNAYLPTNSIQANTVRWKVVPNGDLSKSSPVWEFNLNGTLATDEVLEESTILAYPSPANDILYLQNATLLEGATYEILSILGKKVLKGTYTTNGIQVEGLNSGVYLLKFSNNRDTIPFVKG